MSSLNRMTKRLRWVLPVAAVAVIAGACELDVADPQVIQPGEIEGPAAVPTAINGVIGDLNNMTEHYALYSGLFTDEFILAGTFPTRVQVDERRVLDSNATITGEVNEGLQTARQRAIRIQERFAALLGDDDFDQSDLRRGITIGAYVEGLALLELGELYCNVRLDPESEDLASSDAVVQQALTRFQEAQSLAEQNAADLSKDWAQAAMVGQARAHLFLGSLTGDAGHFDDAALIAANVGRSHRVLSEHSVNHPNQFNKVHDLTFGSQNEVIRWTVGDGNQPETLNEKFAEYDDFVSWGIIDPDFCSSCAFNSSIAVHAPLIYDGPADGIVISSGKHARLIEAEAAIRNGQTGTAEDIINDLRADWPNRWTVQRFGIPGVELDEVELTGNMQDDLLTLMGEYARETWLTGTRQENLRRLVEEFGAGSDMDLYPEKEGDQICWPVPEQEEVGGSPGGS